MRSVTLRTLTLAACASLALAGCDIIDPIFGGGGTGDGEIELQDFSVTEPLVENLAPGVEVFSLISSDDDVPDFRYAGSPDGAGFLKNADGTYSFVTNHEDNYSVSKVILDATLRPIAGEYLMDSDEGLWRKCSATMATPEEHGFGPLFLTSSESGDDNINFAVDPETGQSRLLPALGAWNTENLVPLPKTAYPGRTVVIIGDDDSGASTGFGQVALYVADRVGDLTNGKLYVMMFPEGIETEMEMTTDSVYDITFQEVDNSDVLASPMEFVNMVTAMGPAAFGRVEDLDYRKGNGREVYFNVTGTSGEPTLTRQGRVYRVVLDRDNPTTGTLELLLDGDDPSGPAAEFQNPDNIMVGRDYVYIQEDPNGYGDEDHDAYIYQYDINSRGLQVMMEIDRREDAKFSRGRDGLSPVEKRFGDWEYGALIRITEETGVEDLYILNIQPHTWRDPQLAGIDGGSIRASENQAGQTILVKGLPY